MLCSFFCSPPTYGIFSIDTIEKQQFLAHFIHKPHLLIFLHPTYALRKKLLIPFEHLYYSLGLPAR